MEARLHRPLRHARPTDLETRTVQMDMALSETHTMVQEMRASLMQAKGAKWAIIAMAGVTGFIAGLTGSFAKLTHG
jgi:hypothetical protein